MSHRIDENVCYIYNRMPKKVYKLVDKLERSMRNMLSTGNRLKVRPPRAATGHIPWCPLALLYC